MKGLSCGRAALVAHLRQGLLFSSCLRRANARHTGTLSHGCRLRISRCLCEVFCCQAVRLSSFNVRAVLQLVLFTTRTLVQLVFHRPNELFPSTSRTSVADRTPHVALPPLRASLASSPLCCGDAAPRTRLSDIATQLHAWCLPRVSTASEHLLDTQHEQHVVLLRTSLVSTDIRKCSQRLSMMPQKCTNSHLGNLQFACRPPLLCHHHPEPRPCATAILCWPCCAACCRTCNSFLIHSSLLFQLHNLLHKRTHVFGSCSDLDCCDSTAVLSTKAPARFALISSSSVARRGSWSTLSTVRGCDPKPMCTIGGPPSDLWASGCGLITARVWYHQACAPPEQAPLSR